MENTLSAYTDGLPSGAYLILKVTLPKYGTEFLFPMCTREDKSQKVEGSIGTLELGNVKSQLNALTFRKEQPGQKRELCHEA